MPKTTASRKSLDSASRSDGGLGPDDGEAWRSSSIVGQVRVGGELAVEPRLHLTIGVAARVVLDAASPSTPRGAAGNGPAPGADGERSVTWCLLELVRLGPVRSLRRWRHSRRDGRPAGLGRRAHAVVEQRQHDGDDEGELDRAEPRRSRAKRLISILPSRASGRRCRVRCGRCAPSCSRTSPLPLFWKSGAAAAVMIGQANSRCAPGRCPADCRPTADPVRIIRVEVGGRNRFDWLASAKVLKVSASTVMLALLAGAGASSCCGRPGPEVLGRHRPACSWELAGADVARREVGGGVERGGDAAG